MTKLHVLVIFWCAVWMMMLPGMGQGLRIKPSHVQARAADVLNVTAVASKMATQAGNGTTSNPLAVVKSSTGQAAGQDNDSITTHTSNPHILRLMPVKGQRPKRRISPMNEVVPHHKSRHASTVVSPDSASSAPLLPPPPPPFAYYNKMVSPDGNLEVKEFELVSPSIITESLQQDLIFEPEMEVQDLDLLNKPNRGHIQKLESSPALPLIFNMFQQLMQPEATMKMHNSQFKSPLLQFLNGAMEMDMDHLLEDRLELEKNGKANKKDKKIKKDELKKLFKAKEAAAEVAPTRKEDAIVISCPVHHEQHANPNGQMVEDDVIMVDQCHVV